MQIDNQFKHLKKVLSQSGCKKKAVAAGFYDPSGLFRMEVNTCIFKGPSCPRADLPSGQGTHLCESIHAEIRLSKLIEKFGLSEEEPVVWILGHYYACEPCAKTLKDLGVQELRIREELPDE